ncbi:tetratricopeptide repeat protein [bacterium]|nr:tetratricopeptide repeat protein [bacterium]
MNLRRSLASLVFVCGLLGACRAQTVDEFLRQGDYLRAEAAAQSYLTTAHSRGAGVSDALYRLASCQLALRRYRDALQNFEAARRLAPENSLVYQGLGETHLGLANLREARRCLEKCLALRQAGHQTLLAVRIRLARMAVVRGRYVQAESALKQCLKEISQEPLERPACLIALAQVYIRLARYGEARRVIEDCLHSLPGKHPNQGTCLNLLGVIQASQGHWTEALDYYDQALAIQEQSLGRESVEASLTLCNLASLATSRGEREQAQELYREALAIREKLLGLNHPDLALPLLGLASLKAILQDYGAGRQLTRRAYNIRRAALGEQHPEVADCLVAMAGFYHNEREAAEAAGWVRKALEIRRSMLPPTHPGISSALQNLAGILISQNRWKEAEVCYLESFGLRERDRANTPWDYCACAQALGAYFLSVNDAARAERYLDRCLTVRRSCVGEEHLEVATALEWLALIRLNQDRIPEADVLVRQALGLRERLLPSGHFLLAQDYNILGVILGRQLHFPQSEAAYRKALELREQSPWVRPSELALSLNNLGTYLCTHDQFQEAEVVLRRALELRQRCLPEGHLDTVATLDRLAGLYRDTGRLKEAEKALLGVLEIRTRRLPPNHPDLADALANLGSFYCRQGEYPLAQPRLEQALELERRAGRGQGRISAKVLEYLGDLHSAKSNYRAAEPLLQRALKIRERLDGAESVWVASLLVSLAGARDTNDENQRKESILLLRRASKLYVQLYGSCIYEADTELELGRLLYQDSAYGESEKCARHALEVYTHFLRPDHPRFAEVNLLLGLLKDDQGQLAEAEQFYRQALAQKEKLYEADSDEMESVIYDLARLKISQNALEEADRYARRLQSIQFKQIRMVLECSSENQRLAYFSSISPYDLLGTLRDPAVLDLLLEVKGIVLDSLMHDQASAEHSPADRATLSQLKELRARWSKAYVPGKPTRQLGELAERIEKLEISLGRRRFEPVRARDVQAALPRSTALVEFLRYDRFLEKGEYETRYAAVVLSDTGAARWVDLGSEDELEPELKNYRLLVDPHEKIVRGATVSRPQSHSDHVLRRLHDKLWQPIQKQIPEGIDRVILSPDAALNFISFASLVGSDDRFVAEHYSLAYVASGRDLLAETPSKPVERTAAILADPYFGNAPAGRVASRSGLAFGALEGTAQESRHLQSLLRGSGYKVEAWSQSQASEPRLKSLHSPWILHLATHGFFLSQSDPDAKDIENPMFRSGLALAGAQRAWSEWLKRRPSDGILTAAEAASLDLSQTWLVVLSACQTGEGELSSGEGVLGLRRGFLMAGAQNLLITLWSVSDQETAEIMTDFYRAAIAQGDPALALAQVQRDWLVKLRRQRSLTEAVRIAAPFVINFRGRPGGQK